MKHGRFHRFLIRLLSTTLIVISFSISGQPTRPSTPGTLVEIFLAVSSLTPRSRVYIGIFLHDVNASLLSHLNSTYAFSVELRSFETALPDEVMSTGSIIAAAILATIVIALVVAVIIWSRKSRQPYEILYS